MWLRTRLDSCVMIEGSVRIGDKDISASIPPQNDSKFDRKVHEYSVCCVICAIAENL